MLLSESLGPATLSTSCTATFCLGPCRMDQGPKEGGLGAQASFDSLNGDSDDDAFSEVTGISRRTVSGWGSFANLQTAERSVSRFIRRFVPSHATAQTGTRLQQADHQMLTQYQRCKSHALLGSKCLAWV